MTFRLKNRSVAANQPQGLNISWGPKVWKGTKTTFLNNYKYQLKPVKGVWLS